MKPFKLLIKSSSIVLLLASHVWAYAQLSEEAARQQAVDVVRSKLNIRPAQFLGIRRNEELEQALAVAANGQLGKDFIYTLSPAGYEITEKGIIDHMSTDGVAIYVVVIDRANGSAYTVHGFPNSLEEFEKLMLALGVKILSPTQAEATTEWYQEVNPENRSIAPISSMFCLKQAAERQCQTIPFESGEKQFEAWWKKAASRYRSTPFTLTASPHDGGYLVEWSVLSSSAPGNCGGALLRARLEVGSDGRVGKLTFVPFSGRVATVPGRKVSSPTE